MCLSILRNSSVGNDGTGWTPARRLKDVIWGLNSLFTDLLNFDDPLNIEAAEHFQVNQMHSLFEHFLTSPALVNAKLIQQWFYYCLEY